jgi:hypothetical protein
MGVLTGDWRPLLATLLMLLVMIAVGELYIKRQDTNG